MKRIGLLTSAALVVLAIGAYGIYGFANASDKAGAAKMSSAGSQSCDKAALQSTSSEEEASAKLAGADACCASKAKASGAGSMSSNGCEGKGEGAAMKANSDGSCAGLSKVCAGGVKASSACGGDTHSMSAASFANVYITDDKGNQYAVCPVSGETFKVKANNSYSTVDGKSYYHCCQGCAEKFKANSSVYIEKLNDRISDAKIQFASGTIPTESDMQ